MKDSGITWINTIPQDWDVKRWKAILEERKEKNDPIKTDVILSLGMDYGVIPYSEKEYTGGNKPKNDLRDYHLAHKNDIVMNSMNIVCGSVGISKYYGCVSPVYYVFFPRNDNYNIKYYNLIFQSAVFQKSLIGLGNGILMKESDNGNLVSVRMRIPVGKLNSLYLPCPSIEIQNKIVEKIHGKCERIDDIKKTILKTIDDYKILKEQIITSSVIKGIRTNRKYKHSGFECIGEIPDDWNIIKIRYLGNIQNGLSKGGDFFGRGYPFVSYSDVYRNFQLPDNVKGLVESSEDEQERYSVRKGDIFFTRTSETIEEVGFSCVCTKSIEKSTFAGFLIRFRPSDDKLDTSFAKYYFRSKHLRFYLVKEMNIVIRASLGQDLLKNMPVLIPPKEEQQEIAEYLDKKCSQIDELISQKEQFITELEKYKQSLIYEYVTGKKEVK